MTNDMSKGLKGSETCLNEVVEILRAVDRRRARDMRKFTLQPYQVKFINMIESKEPIMLNLWGRR